MLFMNHLPFKVTVGTFYRKLFRKEYALARGCEILFGKLHQEKSGSPGWHAAAAEA
jgi:hypothetical protein